ncbi:hypothetical protein PTKIN_Ptkin10aG0125800 [Pterospermum kingtungense]
MLPELQSMNDGKAYRSLCIKIGAKRWARAFSPLRRYHFMTSNVAESLNSALRNARKFPVCTVIEFIQGLIQKWFHERGEKAAERTEILTEHVTKMMVSNKSYADFMIVKSINSFEFQVLDGTRERFVNLQEKTCSCRKFQLDLLPYAHAIAAIREVRRGRKKQQVFFICKQPGHNRVNCQYENVIGQPSTSQREEVAEGSTRRRRCRGGVRCCSSCGQTRHTRLTCRTPQMDALDDETNFSDNW